MKTHCGRLVDRWMHGDSGKMTVQTDSGIEEVTVLHDDLLSASRIWGGGSVSFQYRGGKAFFREEDHFEFQDDVFQEEQTFEFQ